MGGGAGVGASVDTEHDPRSEETNNCTEKGYGRSLSEGKCRRQRGEEDFMKKKEPDVGAQRGRTGNATKMGSVG